MINKIIPHSLFTQTRSVFGLFEHFNLLTLFNNDKVKAETHYQIVCSRFVCKMFYRKTLSKRFTVLECAIAGGVGVAVAAIRTMNTVYVICYMYCLFRFCHIIMVGSLPKHFNLFPFIPVLNYYLIIDIKQQ